MELNGKNLTMIKRILKNPKKRYVYLFIIENPYGGDIVPYGTYKKACRALHDHMLKLFEENHMTQEEQKPHIDTYKRYKRYDLPIPGEARYSDFSETAYIRIMQVL